MNDPSLLTCPVCNRSDFRRLTRHLSQVHKLSVEEIHSRFPGITLEVSPCTNIPHCAGCGVEVLGKNPRAVYVKCDSCRVQDNRTKIECEICGICRVRLIAHIRASHGLETSEYLERFPQAKICVDGSFDHSEECKEKQSIAASERWSNPEERKIQSDRLKISAHWKGKNMPSSVRRSIGESMREYIHMKGGPNWGYKNKDTYRKSFDTRAVNGTLASNKYGRGIHGFRADISLNVRSTLEANFVRILQVSGVSWKYEPETFKLGCNLAYIPDFFLEKDLLFKDGTLAVPAGWVELKGWRGSITGEDESKYRVFRTMIECPFTILVSDETVLKRLEFEYRPDITLWESCNSNLRTHPERYR